MIVANAASIVHLRSLLIESILFQSAIEGAIADAELLGGLAAIAVIALKGFLEHLLAHIVEV